MAFIFKTIPIYPKLRFLGTFFLMECYYYVVLSDAIFWVQQTQLCNLRPNLFLNRYLLVLGRKICPFFLYAYVYNFSLKTRLTDYLNFCWWLIKKLHSCLLTQCSILHKQFYIDYFFAQTDPLCKVTRSLDYFCWLDLKNKYND